MRRYRAAAVVAVVAGLAFTGVACGGGDDSASSSTTTAAGATTESTTTTTAEDGGGALEGTWAIDAGEALASATANLGGTGGGTCSGQLTLTFADGTLRRGGSARCGSGTVTVDATGTYTVDGDKLNVSMTSSNTRAEVRGMTVPVPDSWSSGVATYKVVDDTLTITFTQASVGTVTSKYTRVD